VRDIDKPRIVAFGATYKKNCEDVRASPAVEVVQLLQRDGYDVRHVDPLVPGMDYDDCASLIDEADLAVVLVAHDSVVKEVQRLEEALGTKDTRFLYFDH